MANTINKEFFINDIDYRKLRREFDIFNPTTPDKVFVNLNALKKDDVFMAVYRKTEEKLPKSKFFAMMKDALKRTDKRFYNKRKGTTINPLPPTTYGMVAELMIIMSYIENYMFVRFADYEREKDLYSLVKMFCIGWYFLYKYGYDAKFYITLKHKLLGMKCNSKRTIYIDFKKPLVYPHIVGIKDPGYDGWYKSVNIHSRSELKNENRFAKFLFPNDDSNLFITADILNLKDDIKKSITTRGKLRGVRPSDVEKLKEDE